MRHVHPSPSGGSSPWLRICKLALAPLLIVAILASAAWRESHERPLDFWTHSAPDGDYVNICLAHALNIDFWVSQSPASKGREVNANNTLHPGIPLQAASWVAYRLSSIGKARDASVRCESVFTDPSAFWLATRLVAIVTGLVCSALLARTASSHGFLFSMAAGLVYFCYEPAWDYSIRLLGNETFALPLSFAVAWFAYRSLNSPEATSVLKWWAGWGGLCALCWLNKLNYIAWTVAVAPACVTHFAIHRPTIRQVSVRLAAFAGGFVVSAYGITSLMLGSGGLGQILRLHFGVLTHSGSYGNGPDGAVSLLAIRDAIHALSAYRPFLALCAGICALSLWIAFSTPKNRIASSNRSAYLVYLVSTAVLFLAATLKHYGAHYLIAGVPAISLLVLAIGGQIGAKGRLALSLAVGMVLVHSYRQFVVIQQANYRHETEMTASLRAVADLPKLPGDGILWTYRLPNPQFVMELVQYLAGVREVATVMDAKFPTPDLVYFLWIPEVRVGAELLPFDKARWRYAVFDRGNYQHFLTGTQANAREYFEKRCKRVIDGPLTIVFERSVE